MEPSSRVLYQVIATLPDAATAAEYVSWLEDGHVDQVVSRGGAHSALIARVDGEAGSRPRVLTQYVFSTRALFDRYVREFAPALRADGLKRFPPEGGVAMERVVAEIV